MSEVTEVIEDLSGERTCRDCGSTYTLTPSEQRFYTDLMKKGVIDDFGNPVPFMAPKRCKACIRKRKMRREEKGRR